MTLSRTIDITTHKIGTTIEMQELARGQRSEDSWTLVVQSRGNEWSWVAQGGEFGVRSQFQSLWSPILCPCTWPSSWSPASFGQFQVPSPWWGCPLGPWSAVWSKRGSMIGWYDWWTNNWLAGQSVLGGKKLMCNYFFNDFNEELKICREMISMKYKSPFVNPQPSNHSSIPPSIYPIIHSSIPPSTHPSIQPTIHP